MLVDLYNALFPSTFSDKYRYLGAIPYKEDTELFKALLPLILTMDYYAKPKWCPRWVLRLLHLFGNDNSIVRVRNWFLHNLHRKLTKNIMLVDYKLKWTNYDLRISVYGNDMLQDLSDRIETSYYRKGRRDELLEILKDFPEAEGKYWEWTSLQDLETLYVQLKLNETNDTSIKK